MNRSLIETDAREAAVAAMAQGFAGDADDAEPWGVDLEYAADFIGRPLTDDEAELWKRTFRAELARLQREGI
jgi:hypothetical protein